MYVFLFVYDLYSHYVRKEYPFDVHRLFMCFEFLFRTYLFTFLRFQYFFLTSSDGWYKMTATRFAWSAKTRKWSFAHIIQELIVNHIKNPSQKFIDCPFHVTSLINQLHWSIYFDSNEPISLLSRPELEIPIKSIKISLTKCWAMEFFFQRKNQIEKSKTKMLLNSRFAVNQFCTAWTNFNCNLRAYY